MRHLQAGISSALGVLTSVTIAFAGLPAQDGEEKPSPAIPRTWDEQAVATIQLPLATPGASPVPVSADYSYRIPVRPIYKII